MVNRSEGYGRCFEVQFFDCATSSGSYI
jgi:hypothetical protein